MDNKDVPRNLVEQFENLTNQLERNRVEFRENTDRLIHAMSEIMSRLSNHPADARGKDHEAHNSDLK